MFVKVNYGTRRFFVIWLLCKVTAAVTQRGAENRGVAQRVFVFKHEKVVQACFVALLLAKYVFHRVN